MVSLGGWLELMEMARADVGSSLKEARRARTYR